MFTWDGDSAGVKVACFFPLDRAGDVRLPFLQRWHHQKPSESPRRRYATTLVSSVFPQNTRQVLAMGRKMTRRDPHVTNLKKSFIVCPVR